MMGRPLAVFLLILPLFAQDKASAKELELKRGIAAGWVDFASWCRSKGLEDELKPMLDEAQSLDSDNAKLKALRAKPGEGKASESARKEYEKKRDVYAKKLAGLDLQLPREKRSPEA